MKKYFALLPFVFLAFLAFYTTGCKKCYTCEDTCVRCEYNTAPLDTMGLDSAGRVAFLDSVTTMYDSLVIFRCNDFSKTDQDYLVQLGKDSVNGFVCKPTEPWYSEDYCINKPGDESYPTYYNLGGRAKCSEKK